MYRIRRLSVLEGILFSLAFGLALALRNWTWLMVWCGISRACAIMFTSQAPSSDVWVFTKIPGLSLGICDYLHRNRLVLFLRLLRGHNNEGKIFNKLNVLTLLPSVESSILFDLNLCPLLMVKTEASIHLLASPIKTLIAVFVYCHVPL